MPVTTSPALPLGTFSSRPQPVLTAGPVVLRPWDPADVASVVAGYADPDIRRWHARTLDPDEALAWIEHWPTRWAAESGAGWALQTDGQVAGEIVGQISLHNIDRHEAFVDLSYWVLPAARGRGVATAALTALTDWVFTLGVHRAQLDHSTRNPASCRVATGAGYLPEGTARARGLHDDGWHDMHLHARLAPA